MEFKRVEMNKVTRHFEQVFDLEEIRTILKKIKDMRVPSIFKVKGYPKFSSTYVLDITDKVVIFSQEQKLKLTVDLKDVEGIEVLSNSEIVDEDKKGRWAYI